MSQNGQPPLMSQPVLGHPARASSWHAIPPQPARYTGWKVRLMPRSLLG